MCMQYMLHSDLFTTSILIPHFACQYNQFAGVTNVITVYVNVLYFCDHKIICFQNTDLVKSAVVKRSDCILVYGSTTKDDVVKRSDCILVYGSTTKGGVVKRSDCILVHGSTTKGDMKKFNCTYHLILS